MEAATMNRSDDVAKLRDRLQVLVTAVSVLGLAGLTAPGHADEPAKPAEPKTYLVSCKLTRKVLFDTAEGKRDLETIESKVPDLTMLQGTRAEYHSGGKVGSVPYGFELRVKVTGDTKNKVRLEITAEDSAAEGSHIHRQHVVRPARLARPIKLELDSNKQGEGVWVELTVQESPDE
jgi:hypothetical protein